MPAGVGGGTVPVMCADAELALELALPLPLPLSPPQTPPYMGLVLSRCAATTSLQLSWAPQAPEAGKEATWRVDFLDSAHRRRARKAKGGKGLPSESLHKVFSFASPPHAQLVSPALDGTRAHAHVVVDLTAGLGTDAFVLAAAGLPVVLCGRQPVLFHLLDDALKRLRGGVEKEGEEEGGQEEAALRAIGRRMHVLQLDATTGPDSLVTLQSALATHASSSPPPHVSVYLDPMYPDGVVGKRAAVKKGAQMLRRLVPNLSTEQRQRDEEALLRTALALASSSSRNTWRGGKSGRVVVKRPKGAPPLAGVGPSSSSATRTHRFDVYMPAEVRS